MNNLLFHHYTPIKEHPNWTDLKKEADLMARKILEHLTIYTPMNRMKLMKRRVLAIIKTVKNLIRNKYKMARMDHDFIPLFYIWTMTNACNFKCNYCSNHRGGKYPDLYREGLRKNLTTEQGKQLIKVMKESSAIYYCGGEPTLRRDLPELLNYSTKLNMFNMINTNGSLIGDLLLKPAYKDFLMQMDVVIISLDSLEIPKLARMYDVSESAARKVLRNILLLNTLREYVPFKLVANTVITQETVADSFDILDFCNDLGITFSPVAMNIGHQPDAKLLAGPEYTRLVNLILERAQYGYPMIASTNMLEKLLFAKFTDCYPTVFDHVDFNGRMFWPCKTYDHALKINMLNYKNVQEAHAAAARQINPDFFHGTGQGKCNGSCAWMQDCVTDFYANALIRGFFGSKIFSEIGGLIN